MNETDNIFSRSVLDLFTVLNEFCMFMDKAGNYSKSDILEYSCKILPLMYVKGAMVPMIDVEYPDANERFVTEEQWQDMFNGLRVQFGKDDTFTFCDPDSDTKEHSLCSLSEDLADIYQDARDFVLLYSKNMQAARENAIREIAMLFKSHWGFRITRCLTHIHFLLYRSHIESEEVFEE